MGAVLEKAQLERLHKAGISKSTDHVFVYRYPESDDMPAMDFEAFVQDMEKAKRSSIKAKASQKRKKGNGFHWLQISCYASECRRTWKNARIHIQLI